MIRKALSRGLLAAVLTAGVTTVLSAPASAQPRRVEVGTLECRGSSSVGFIIGSKRTLNCVLNTTRGPDYNYTGSIRRWGLDLGITGRNVLLWTVLAPTRRIGPADISGSYVGASGSVALGIGVAGNVLVGGSNKTIALQPISVEGQTGVNLALGVGDLTLRNR